MSPYILDVGDFVRNTRMSSDGSVLVVTTVSGAVQVWNLRTRCCISCSLACDSGARDCMVSPDGLVAVTLLDGCRQVKVTYIVSGRTCLQNHTRQPEVCAFSNDSRRLVVGDSGGRITQYATSMECRIWETRLKMDSITSCIYQQDVIAVSSDVGALHLLSGLTGDVLMTASRVHCYAVSADERFLYRVGTGWMRGHNVQVNAIDAIGTGLQSGWTETSCVDGCVINASFFITYGDYVIVRDVNTLKILGTLKLAERLSECTVHGTMLIGHACHGDRAYVWCMSALPAWRVVWTNRDKAMVPQLRPTHMGRQVYFDGLVIAAPSGYVLYRASMRAEKLLVLAAAAKRRQGRLAVPPECMATLHD